MSVYAQHSDLGLIAKIFALADGNASQAAILAEGTKASSRIVEVFKAAVASGSLSDESWAGALAPYSGIVAAFVEGLRSQSVFVRMLDDMKRAPLRTPIAVTTTAAVGTIVGEGAWKPVTRLTLAQPTLASHKAIALLVLSKDILLHSSDAAKALVNTELRNAVTAAIDGEFLSLIADSITPIVSSGDDADAIRTDLGALLAAVTTHAGSRLFWVFDVATAKGLSIATGGGGIFMFPAMGPLGGEVLNLPALVTDKIEEGTAMLVDASGLVGDMTTITLAMSSQSALQMSDAPSAGAQAVVSLWQTNSVAMKAEAHFGVERFRDSAAAVLTDINWGAAPSGS